MVQPNVSRRVPDEIFQIESKTRGKNILEKLSKPRFFYRVWKSRPFLPCCVAAEKSARLLNPVKNRGFESCSNISFPLEQRQYKNDSIQSKIIPILKFARFSTPIRWGKKHGKFKIGIISDWMESFLYCLCSRLKMIFTYTVQ